MIRKIFSLLLFIFGGGFIGTIMILAGIKSNKENTVKLNELSFHKGKLEYFFVAYKLSTSGIPKRSKFLAMKIDGLNQLMGLHRPDQVYTDIFENVSINDSVSLYYRKHSPNYDHFTSGQSYNPDIYELVINRKEYLNINSVKAGRSTANTVVIILGFLMYLLIIISAFFQIKKIRKERVA